MEIGTANYSGSAQQKTVFKLSPGSNVFRILPPIGKGAAQGKWFQYYSVAWGLKDTSGEHKPFQDCFKQNFKTKMVEVESEHRLLKMEIEAQKAEAIKGFKEGKVSKETVQELTDLSMRFNLDKKYYLNAVDLTGKIGLLKLGYKAMKQLEDLIKRIQQEDGIDPLGLETGIFFEIVRTGEKFDTSYSVGTYQENVTVNVNGVNKVFKENKMHVMDQAFINRLGSEAYELLGMYPELTPEENRQAIRGTAADVDAIFARFSNTAPVAAPVAAPAIQPMPVATPVAAPVIQPVAAPAIQPIPVATPVAAPVAAPAAQSDEDFLRSIGAI